MAIDLGPIGIWCTGWLWDQAGDEAGEAAVELDELGFGAIWLSDSRADLDRQERILSATERIVAATGIVNIWINPADELAASYRRLCAEYPDRGSASGRATPRRWRRGVSPTRSRSAASAHTSTSSTRCRIGSRKTTASSPLWARGRWTLPGSAAWAHTLTW